MCHFYRNVFFFTRSEELKAEGKNKRKRKLSQNIINAITRTHITKILYKITSTYQKLLIALFVLHNDSSNFFSGRPSASYIILIVSLVIFIMLYNILPQLVILPDRQPIKTDSFLISLDPNITWKYYFYLKISWSNSLSPPFIVWRYVPSALYRTNVNFQYGIKLCWESRYGQREHAIINHHQHFVEYLVLFQFLFHPIGFYRYRHAPPHSRPPAPAYIKTAHYTLDIIP